MHRLYAVIARSRKTRAEIGGAKHYYIGQPRQPDGATGIIGVRPAEHRLV